MSRDAKIAPTAHYTAYAWHRLGLSHADLFVTPRGRRLYWAFRAGGEWIARTQRATPLLVDVLAYRHLLIDRELSRLAPDRVIELGAGLSRRGLASVLDHGVARYLEIDLPHMASAKRAALDRAPRAIRDALGTRLEVRAVDLLSPDVGAILASELRGARRAVVIAEGVLGYFPLSERAHIVRAIAEGLAAADEGAFLCDLRDTERAGELRSAIRFMRGAVRLVTRGRGLREDFASASVIRAFFAQHGLASAEPVEPPPPHLAHLRMPVRVWRVARSEIG